MSGSLKELVRVLTNALAQRNCYPLSDELGNTIQAYLDKHFDIDEHDSQRLHDELLHLYNTRVANHPDKHAAFLAALRGLRPALNGVERLLSWWDILVRPTLDSLGQAKAVVADARAIVLSVLVYDEDDNNTGEKARAAAVFTEKLFEVFLEKSKVAVAETPASFAEEEKQRFVVSNVEAVLLAYGKRKPKAFMEHIDTYVMQKEYRLQVLSLLCSFVRLQGPHLYQVLQTPLLEHLLQCLQIDTSTTAISLVLTILIMFMPHICNSLSRYLPQLFYIYTRILCWDKYGVVGLEEFPTPVGSGKETHRADSPVSGKEDSAGNVWQKLESSFETATSTTPDVGDFFTFLYGLYPLNLVAFIREPYKFLERADFKDLEDLDLDEETIRIRTEQYRQRHTLHPNFLTLTRETELTDQTRWMKMEPADVTALCIGLVSTNMQLPEDEKQRHKGPLPAALIPTEDIPIESLLSAEEDPAADDEIISVYSGDPSFSWKEPGQNLRGTKVTSGVSDTSGPYRGTPPNRSFSNSPAGRGNESRVPDSPTLPAHSAKPSVDDPRVHSMLQLQEALRAAPQGQLKNESNPSLANDSNGYGSVAASPRLEAYVHSLNQSNIPRSPAVRPAASDTQATVAFLQREVMLLKNDLNFERYLKQQHLSHIGHLQRKHIKESAAEAETQNLIYTNKALKAKIEEAKKAYVRSKTEALAQKNQAKKWEAELNSKIRALREEQKNWKAEEETLKRALDTAQKDVEHLRRLVAESEAKELLSRQRIKALEGNVEELERLRESNEQLRNQLKELEVLQGDFEMAKHNEESAVAQSDRIKLRLQSQQQEKEKMKRAFEVKIQELENRLNSSPSPTPQAQGNGFQSMVDSALQAANSRVASLKRAHQILLAKYTDLEIKYIELQASHEIHHLSGNQFNMRDGGFPSQHSELGPSGDYRGHHAHHSQHMQQFPSELAATEPLSPLNPDHLSSHQSAYFQAQHPNAKAPSRSQSIMSTNTMGHSSPYNGYNHYLANNPPPATPLPPVPGHLSALPMPAVPTSPYPGHMSQYREERPSVGSMPSTPSSNGHSTGLQSPIEANDDTKSVKTVGGSSQSSTERKERERVKVTSEVRVRGRGGVQNIGKKEKDKEKDKDKDKEGKEEGRRRLRLPGSGFAGIRGFH